MTTVPTPVEIDDVTLAFPAKALDFMPAWDDIPQEFRDRTSPWCDFVKTWMFKGLCGRVAFKPAKIDGVPLDGNTIWRQLNAIMGSYAPRHEHKEAALAYLSSLWMESLTYGPKDCEIEDMKALGVASLEDWREHLEKENP